MRLQKKNYEIITDELRRIIESGIVKPGDKLETIDKLALQYRVSRSTIREAISHLKALGMVESRQGGGTYVKDAAARRQNLLQSLQHSNVELTQILQVRKILEIGTIEIAAMQRSEQDVEILGRIVSQMEDAEGNEEISHIYDTNFHLAIAKASQNPILETMMGYISQEISRTIQDSRKLWLYSEKETGKRLYEEHKKMFEAIRDHDGKTAADTMLSHLGKVESALRMANP